MRSIVAGSGRLYRDDARNTTILARRALPVSRGCHRAGGAVTPDWGDGLRSRKGRDLVSREAATVKGDDHVWVQLATRIPKELHRQLKLHCVQTDTSLMEFVVSSIEEKLAKADGRKRAGRAE